MDFSALVAVDKTVSWSYGRHCEMSLLADLLALMVRRLRVEIPRHLALTHVKIAWATWKVSNDPQEISWGRALRL